MRDGLFDQIEADLISFFQPFFSFFVAEAMIRRNWMRTFSSTAAKFSGTGSKIVAPKMVYIQGEEMTRYASKLLDIHE